MSEIDFKKMNIPQLNFDYTNNMINSIQRDTEKKYTSSSGSKGSS